MTSRGRSSADGEPAGWRYWMFLALATLAGGVWGMFWAWVMNGFSLSFGNRLF